MSMSGALVEGFTFNMVRVATGQPGRHGRCHGMQLVWRSARGLADAPLDEPIHARYSMISSQASPCKARHTTSKGATLGGVRNMSAPRACRLEVVGSTDGTMTLPARYPRGMPGHG